MGIALLFATKLESAGLTGRITGAGEIDGVLTGRLYGREVLVRIIGIGKVNAAYGAAMTIERYRPEMVVSIGIGGAYPSSGLSVGDVAVADTEIYGDEGVETPDGFIGLREIGIPMLDIGGTMIFNIIELDTGLADKAFKSIARDINCKKGRFVTVSRCSGTMRLSHELVERYHGICENMEGAAIAHISKIYNTPMVEIRGISNIVRDRDMREWDIKGAVDSAATALCRFIEGL